MSLPYFIASEPARGELDGAEGRHAVTVKRIAVGERIMLVDGAGDRRRGHGDRGAR